MTTFLSDAVMCADDETPDPETDGAYVMGFPMDCPEDELEDDEERSEPWEW